MNLLDVIKKHDEDEEKILGLLHEIAVPLDQLRTGDNSGWSWSWPDGWSADGDVVSVHYSAYRCGCCGPDTYSVEIPRQYLDADFDWRSIETAQLEGITVAKTIAAIATQCAINHRRDAKERAEFERLKARFG